MIYSLTGKVSLVTPNFVVVDVVGIGFKVFCLGRVLAQTQVGDSIRFLTHLYLKEERLEFYGFTEAEELSLFGLLNLVNGVGPRSALAIMNVARSEEVLAAIKEERADLLSRAAGVGSKLAERIILELKNKVEAEGAARTVSGMESSQDLLEALVGLGYRRDQVRSAISKIGGNGSLEERLKSALKILSGK